MKNWKGLMAAMFLLGVLMTSCTKDEVVEPQIELKKGNQTTGHNSQGNGG